MSNGNMARELHRHFDQLLEKLPSLPPDVSWLLPYQDLPETARLTQLFLNKFYNDKKPRTLILGINPGRFGAGITNVAFTDPMHLEQVCGIENSFKKRAELSAVFIYKMIAEMGGPKLFYEKFFINSVVPFGFTKNKINYNYYDDKILQNAMEPFIKFHLENLLKIGIKKEICFCLGTGKNYKYLNKLNEREKYFERVVPLAHPRYIMQYKRKELNVYLNEYTTALNRK